MRPGIGTLLADEFKFLCFRRTSAAVREHGNSYLAMGLAFAWLAGIGRYWDNPRADWWQHAGLGSVLYVFVLAGILWAALAPLNREIGTYRNVLLFVAMTSPPAILYAVPVERFLPADTARGVNAWFLGVVAAWRVALWADFLGRTARLGPVTTFVTTVLPPALVVTALAMLNLEHVVFSLMGGIRPDERSPHDDAYGVVVTLAVISTFSSLVLVPAYFVCCLDAVRRKEASAFPPRDRRPQTSDPPRGPAA